MALCTSSTPSAMPMVRAGACMAWIGARSVVPSEPMMCGASYRGVGLGDLLLYRLVPDAEVARHYEHAIDAHHEQLASRLAPRNLGSRANWWCRLARGCMRGTPCATVTACVPFARSRRRRSSRRPASRSSPRRVTRHRAGVGRNHQRAGVQCGGGRDPRHHAVSDHGPAAPVTRGTVADAPNAARRANAHGQVAKPHTGM